MGSEVEISGNVEMYLATIATLQTEEQPVPLSQLAEHLSHSPVSVNEMCRKLVERGWATYQPYKGVKLTPEGATLAHQVLRRRRLWETFLLERLGADADEARVFACHLEHATPDDLARRLAEYLAKPEPATARPTADASGSQVQRLSHLISGQRARVTHVAVDDAVASEFLSAQGIVPGAELTVLAVSSDGSLLLETAARRLTLCRDLATQIEALPIPMEKYADSEVR
ncbi:MAG: metal-dependent transcriptional regulator [Ardenticatenia bacterium]|jgi:DtxR family Mn-dependent transcriptional regulator|nr:MAG: metal-dependent transcriptional regulator [Ardenticatenia bacterium]